MSEPLLLGFDVGTSAVKAAAFTLRGTPVAVASRQIRLDAPREGICEVDPRAVASPLVVYEPVEVVSAAAVEREP